MRFTSIIATAVLLTQAIALDVACLVSGVRVAVVDLDTGICPFTIPSGLPILFDFVSPQDYNIIFYYSIAAGERYFNDIVHAGNIISIPAKILFNTPGAPLYQVRAQKEPASNSTEALRRRLWKDTVIEKRDDASDFAETLKDLDGTLVGPDVFQVVPVDEATCTEEITTEVCTVVNVVTCTKTVCEPTTVPAKPTCITTTVNEVVTVLTTYCPESSIAVPTFIVTITEAETVITCPATPALTTVTSAGVTTVVVTTVPVTQTVTKPAAPGVATATTPAAPAGSAVATASTPGAPGASGAATVAPAGSTTNAVVSTFGNGAASVGSTFLALALIPLGYLI
ncbi:uncharacterized protein SPAPADRAFT_72045 [Spathaspora passalidarum NRRL Y-27907]|uniref:Flo11 domain-containing protein n=1 Tax=Spathaspora passalidarum (strain NRRL Y-27907 / 11-Y1) TaxID=619300 RepID=G3AQV6_SPAPN|nr:uncharacterized protein SPAPADRAFT_72045 [Spathaspora passalidarum NRRL Y-27907]EGW31185.1 hypothetical protein SPAPADRAFT_72045 [Spathaspora passalidarum NRRL Y-27907]